MRYYYFLVEGPHDEAAIGKVLQILGLRQIRNKEEIPYIWQGLIPNKYPFVEGRLEKISPIPDFYKSDNVCVAIKAALGETRIISELNNTMLIMQREQLKQLNGILVVCDADNKSANEKYNEFILNITKRKELNFDETCFINKEGYFKDIKIKCDIYVFPNNKDCGTLEDILLEGAKIQYDNLLENAINYIENIDDKYKSKLSTSKHKKAIIGSMASVLNPGVANQVSIKNDKWIDYNNIYISEKIKILYNFIENFIKN
jgi:hypothetical protein